MTGRRLTGGLATGAIVAAVAAMWGIAPAHGQPAPRLDLVDQTVFVDDEPASIVVAIEDAPANSRIGVTIHQQPRRTRASVRAGHLDPPVGGDRIAAFRCTLDGDCFDQAMLERNPAGEVTITLDDTVIGESLRRATGALIVVVRLLDTDGAVLDELVTSFVVLNDVTERRARIAFLATLDAPLAHQADQDISIDPAPLLDRVTSLPDALPVTFAIQPETLTALDATAPAALARLQVALDARPVLRAPWVEMDEEAWRQAEQSDRVVDQYAHGAATVESRIGISPSPIARPDPDARPATLALLRAAGVSVVIVDDDRLDDAVAATDAHRPVTILDGNGVAMPALRIDEALHDTLDHPDPELAAVRAVTELTMALHDRTVAADVATLLEADRIAPATLDAFLALVAGRREFRLSDVDTLAVLDPERVGGTAPRAELSPTPAPDVTGLVPDLRAATAAVETLRSMLEPDTASIEPLTTLLRAAASSELTVTEASAYTDAVIAAVGERTTGIELPEGERITLTDRRTDLPLTIVNNQPVALNVELILSAEKLRFPDGERLTLRLLPGDNAIVVPVQTLASGDARVSATVVAPGGALELATGTVDIRSTAISGLGLAISIIALLILGAWWIRTILRVRRNRAAATVAAASAAVPTSPTGEPVEGET